MFINLMLFSTKQNVGKIVKEPRKMIDVIINNNVLQVYVYSVSTLSTMIVAHAKFKKCA